MIPSSHPQRPRSARRHLPRYQGARDRRRHSWQWTECKIQADCHVRALHRYHIPFITILINTTSLSFGALDSNTISHQLNTITNTAASGLGSSELRPSSGYQNIRIAFHLSISYPYTSGRTLCSPNSSLPSGFASLHSFSTSPFFIGIQRLLSISSF